MYASYGSRWRARGDHSPRATRRQTLRSFYIAEHTARARACGSHCSCSLAFSLRLCFETRLVQPAFCFRLSRRSALSALVSGKFSSFFFSGLCSALVSSLLSTLLPSLFCFCLISASVTPLARRVRLLL